MTPSGIALSTSSTPPAWNDDGVLEKYRYLPDSELIAIPPERHSLLAESDCVVLLTVRLG